jgi:hypothetical protein
MKTYTTILLIAAILLSATSYAQYNNIKANGNIVTKNRTVDKFDKISVTGSFEITLIEGKEGDINIKASENIINVIVTEVINGTLNIKFKNGINIQNTKSLDVTIYYEDIDEISLAGSGDIKANNTLKCKNLSLNLTGSGNFKLAIDSNNLATSIAGSGNMNLFGKTETFDCSVSGSGNINSSQLIGNIVNAKVSGSGNIKIYAEKELYAQSSGSGNIIYSGNPGIIKSNSSGSGDIRHQN